MYGSCARGFQILIFPTLMGLTVGVGSSSQMGVPLGFPWGSGVRPNPIRSGVFMVNVTRALWTFEEINMTRQMLGCHDPIEMTKSVTRSFKTKI